MKTCGNCALYRPSPYNPEKGNGGCKVMEDWEARHKKRGTKPSDKARRDVYLEIGGRFGEPSALCHPDQDRELCNRFNRLEGINNK